MRRRIGFGLVSIALALILFASTTRGQGKRGFGGFPGGGFPGGGFGGGNRDPNMMFDYLAKGRGYFLVTETRRLQEPLSQFLQTKSITNGQVTRELFSAFNEQSKGGSPGGFGGPPQMNQGPGGMPSPFAMAPQGNPLDTLNQWAEAEFKVRDRNGDGFLNQDEMTEQLKSELSKWDTNRDNLISMDEFKIYFAARMQSRRGGGNQSANPITIILEEEDLETRPVVYRAGKLPTKELPPWFMELDTDKDGQVALYEWRKGGKDLEEFRAWDRNNDGFITAEEALSKQRALQLASANTKTEDGDLTSATVTTAKVSGPNFAPGANNGDEPRGRGKGGKKGFNKGDFKRPQ